ncbi:MAG: LapA family protein [Eudoraea sp.]|uniref:LapA family protein n=1 Tax=Eudoraea sp. TaxID=1979955 RepID=UPI003C7757AC
MKQTTYLVLTIITLIFIVVFTLQNTGEVSINLLFWNIKTSMALLIFSLFSFGVIIAIFVLTPIIIALKSTLKKDKKIISELQGTNEVYSEKKVDNE